MSGNTKLLGFGADNKITLERWGKQATMALTSEAIDALKEMCFDMLPKQPPKKEPREYCCYDYSRGVVEMSLSPEKAKMLADIFQSLDDSIEQTSDAQEQRNLIRDLLVGLYLSIDEHLAYINTSDEPGVE